MRRAFRLGFGRSHVEREVDDELAFHVEMRARQLMEQGLGEHDARREAERQFGDVAAVRDSCVTLDHERERAMRRTDVVDGLKQDLGFALRTLRRNFGFAAVVVLTLALGIGANAAIFTLVHAVLLRPIPVRDPAALVVIGNPARVSSLSDGNPRMDLISYPLYTDIKSHNTVFTDVLASGRTGRLDVRVDSGTALEHPRGRFVSANYFAVLGVPAFRGRVFDGTEDQAVGGGPVVVISHGYWQRRFSGDPGTIGRRLLVGAADVVIIGITPPDFTGEIVGSSPDVWMPLGMQPVIRPNQELLSSRNNSWLLLLGRRKAGVSLEQVRAELDPFVRRQVAENFGVALAVAEPIVRRMPDFIESGARGFSRVRSTYRAPLLTLLGGVGLLLLIICGNVANLLLARAVARGREMSVRLALGAARARLVRQLLTESLVMALAGAGLGVALAWWGSTLLLKLAADGGSILPLDVRPNLPVVAFTVLLSLLAMLLFGLAPAMRGANADIATAMRAHARSVGALGSRGQRAPLGKVLIVAQVALSLVLLVGAGLQVRSLRHLETVDTGIDRDHVLIVDPDVIGRGLQRDRLVAFARDMAERLGRIPGVTGVTYSENGIFSGTESNNTVNVPGFEARESGDTNAFYDLVGPGYAQTIGARLVRGREFALSDDARAANVAMINETMAKFFFPGRDAIGGRLRLDDSTWADIVGVVADTRDHNLTQEPVRRFYIPLLQNFNGYPGQLRFEVHTAGNPAELTRAIRSEITASDPLLVIAAIDPLSQLMRQSVGEDRLLARLAAGFGVVALLLSAIGLYGVMTYAIVRRTGEIGLRVALGADRSDVIGMVLGEALRQVAVGALIGVPLALGAARLIGSQLHGVGATDPITVLVALLVLAASASLAALLPALRAARVAPVVALSQD